MRLIKKEIILGPKIKHRNIKIKKLRTKVGSNIKLAGQVIGFGTPSTQK